MNEHELGPDCWNQVRGKVKEKWGRLTDDDLGVIGGKAASAWNHDQLFRRCTGTGRGRRRGKVSVCRVPMSPANAGLPLNAVVSHPPF